MNLASFATAAAALGLRRADYDLPFSTVLRFDRLGSGHMSPHTMVGPLEFSADLTSGKNGAHVWVTLVADGTNSPTFNGIFKWNTSEDFVTTPGTRNLLHFFYAAGMAGYEISAPLPAGPVITVPDAPTNLVATAGEGFVSVSFTPPINDGGADLDNFRVTLSNGASEEGTSSPIVVETTATTPLTATAAAHNSAGWSLESGPSNSVTPTPAYMLAGNRASMPAGTITNSSGYKSFNDRHSITNRSGTAINKVKLFFVNQEGNGLSSNPGSQTFTMEAGAGPETGAQSLPRQRLTFNGGQNQVALAPGQGIWTDAFSLATDLAPGSSLGVVVNTLYATAPTRLVASGTPSSRPTVDVNEASVTTLPSKALSGLFTGRAENRHINGPVAMIGVPTSGLDDATAPRIIGVGDSIPAGANDGTTGIGLTGFAQRGFATVPYVTTAMSGYLVSAAFSNSPEPSDDFLRKMLLIGPQVKFTHAFVCLGGNDVRSGSDAATILSSLNYMRQWFAARGIKMIPCTGLPRTNGNNTGPNLVDAPGAMAQYQIVTDTIRQNNGWGNGFFDRHALLGDPANEARWRTDLGGNVYDDDGIHLTTLGHTTLANALSASIPTLFSTA